MEPLLELVDDEDRTFLLPSGISRPFTQFVDRAWTNPAPSFNLGQCFPISFRRSDSVSSRVALTATTRMSSVSSGLARP